MEAQESRTPRKKPMGPGPVAPEKAKNFKSAIKRLLKELKGFQILILISLILAALGAILSIIAPDHLSNLVNKISDGLVINKENMEVVTEKVMSNLEEEKLNSIMPKILMMDMSEENIQKVMMSTEITPSEKQEFQELLSNLSNIESKALFGEISKLPSSILEIILPDSTYKETSFDTRILITSKEKQQLLTNGLINKERVNRLWKTRILTQYVLLQTLKAVY